MIRASLSSSLACVTIALLAACGGNTPEPKTEQNPTEPQATPRKSRSGEAPSVSQELGSIDQRAVEVMTNKLINGKLETCHKRGRDRVEYLTGDVKMFFRIDASGKVKYSYFEGSDLGDRETEKCILDTFAAADWPKPKGGEAEVRNGFGWGAGGERAPASWGAEKVTAALAEDKDVKASIEKCKAGVSGSFTATAYVEPGEVEAKPEPAAAHPAPGKKGAAPHKAAPGAKPAASTAEHGGKFKAIGITPPGKDGADKVDCLVDALKNLSLPSPGSYAAKVTFGL